LRANKPPPPFSSILRFFYFFLSLNALSTGADLPRFPSREMAAPPCAMAPASSTMLASPNVFPVPTDQQRCQPPAQRQYDRRAGHCHQVTGLKGINQVSHP
jgi:hypothetical protein